MFWDLLQKRHNPILLCRSPGTDILTVQISRQIFHLFIYLFILTYKIREFRLFICSQAQSKIKFCTGAHKPQAACNVPLQGTWYSEKQSNIHCIFSVNTFFPIRTQIQANARYLDNNTKKKIQQKYPPLQIIFSPFPDWFIYLILRWNEEKIPGIFYVKKKIIN